MMDMNSKKPAISPVYPKDTPRRDEVATTSSKSDEKKNPPSDKLKFQNMLADGKPVEPKKQESPVAKGAVEVTDKPVEDEKENLELGAKREPSTEKSHSLFDLSSNKEIGVDEKLQVGMQGVAKIENTELKLATGEGKDITVGNRSDIRALAEKMVDQIQVIVKTDVSETTVTLKGPNTFAGAEITVKEFNSAKGEFNVEFTGLKAEGKELLDMPLNQDGLRAAMVERGFALHIISTNIENRDQLMSDAREAFRDNEDQEERRQRGKHGDRDAEGEEEA
jgi:hypothetical protein